MISYLPRTAQSRKSKISVVVPLFEESDNLHRLVEEIQEALRGDLDLEYEIILVDDGSTDSSWEAIEELHEADSRIKGVRLSRNFGHQAALTAGYAYAKGDAIITMDGDLQHPPQLLPAMILRWREGYDVVSMVRRDSPDESWLKLATSRGFYKLFNALSDVKIRAGVADFRLIDKRVAKQLVRLKEKARFIRGLISWTGFKEIRVPYIAAPRFAGHTKYSLRKMVMLAANAVSSFSSAPLQLIFYAAVALNFGCVILMGYAVYNKLHDSKDLSEWASTFLTMVCLSGLQLLMMGIVGLYIGRIFDEVKGRPVYVVGEELGVVSRVRRRAARSLAAVSNLNG